jgi:hypothetical protein
VRSAAVETATGLRIDCYQLTVDHRIVVDCFDRLGYRQIAVTDDLSVARIKVDLTALDRGDHPKPIPFAFKHPIRVVERRVDECCQHGLQGLRQCR